MVFQGYRQGIIAFKTNNEIADLFTLISLIVHQMKNYKGEEVDVYMFTKDSKYPSKVPEFRKIISKYSNKTLMTFFKSPGMIQFTTYFKEK